MYDLLSGGSHHLAPPGIGTNTTGRGYPLGDLFTVSPGAIPSTEPPFLSDGHLLVDHRGWPHGSPGEVECTEDQYGNLNGLPTAQTSDYDLTINSPQVSSCILCVLRQVDKFPCTVQ